MLSGLLPELRDSWKEELKKKRGTKVSGYKQVGSKDHILGSSW